jgi:adenylate cyclase class IV
MARRNLELKLRVADLRAARLKCAEAATRAVVMEQVDTYFHTRRGRLKLRESHFLTGTEGPAPAGEVTLIAYHRPDRADVRASDYQLVPVSDAVAMKDALSATLGLRGVVRKRREVLMYHNVRIHLDEVEGLGTFVELEAVVSHAAEEALSRSRLDALCDLLGLEQGEGIAGSYADLLGI